MDIRLQLEGNLNFVVELIEWQTEAVSTHTAICSDTTGDDHIDTAIMRQAKSLLYQQTVEPL